MTLKIAVEVGFVDGVKVGETLGSAVGERVGLLDGVKVGDGDGNAVLHASAP